MQKKRNSEKVPFEKDFDHDKVAKALSKMNFTKKDNLLIAEKIMRLVAFVLLIAAIVFCIKFYLDIRELQNQYSELFQKSM